MVVADTTPLNYLILIGQEHVLGALFDKVLIPEGFLKELKNPKAPEAELLWIPAGHECLSPVPECLSPEVLSSICPLRPTGHSSNLSHHLIP